MHLPQRVLQFFDPPVFADASKTHLEDLLNRILLSTVALWMSGLILQAAFGLLVSWQYVGVELLGILLMLLLRQWMRRGAVRQVVILLSSLIWVIFTTVLYLLGGIHTPHITAYMVIITFATLLSGLRTGAVFTLLSIGATLALGRAEALSLLPVRVPLSSASQQIIIIILTCIFFVMIAMTRKSMSDDLDNIERQVAQRREAEEELRLLNASLDQRVAERTRALEAEIVNHRQTEAALLNRSEALRESEAALRSSEATLRISEATVRISEASFREIYENAPFAYQSLDRDGSILAVNKNLCDLLGYEREEMLGRPFGDFWTSDTRPYFKERFESFIQNGQTHTDLHLQHKDGRSMFIILEGRIQTGAEGQFIRTHCILMDVTERQQVYSHTQRQNELFAALYQGTLAFLNHRSVDDLLQSLVDQAAQLLNAPYGEIATLAGDELTVRSCTANQSFLRGDHSMRGEARLTWQAVDTREPVVLDDYQQWEFRRPVFSLLDLHGVAEIPILSGDGQECLGVIGLGRVQINHPFSQDEIQIGKLYAQIAGLAIENAQLQASLREQSIRDPLTGLYNRRYLFETLQRELARAARENYPVSFVLLDIDNFKHLNDQYGHGAGDVMLCAMAQQFTLMVRAGDILCRYGGDEHLIVMYKTPGEVAFARAEQWRKAIEALVVEHEGWALKITISMGVVTYADQYAETIDQVIARADYALYQSKNNGRNMVTVYKAD